MRRSWLAGLVLALAAVGVGYAEVKVGDLRAVQAKAGTALRREPNALAPTVANLPYGTRALVQEVRNGWARVQTTAGTGWVRGGELVEPQVLTGGGAFGPRGVDGARAAGVSAAEVSAAGRQFAEATEESYRRQTPNLEPYFALVDAIEERKPSPEDVEAFINEGRLGR
jgi:hypothetical protein